MYFRIGRSDSNGPTIPTNFDNFLARAAKQTVLHYNQGWAKGFKYGIKYWEIWNEPDFTPFWSGTPQQYFELYQKVATAVREADPDAIIGGPTSATFSDKSGMRATFLKFVSDNKLPLDFYSFHKYTDQTQDPFGVCAHGHDPARGARHVRVYETELSISEFETSLMGESVLGDDAGQAGFMAQSLIYLQQAGVARSFNYGRISSPPSKENLAFSAISKLNATPVKLCSSASGKTAALRWCRATTMRRSRCCKSSSPAIRFPSR